MLDIIFEGRKKHSCIILISCTFLYESGVCRCLDYVLICELTSDLNFDVMHEYIFKKTARYLNVQKNFRHSSNLVFANFFSV